MTNIWTKLGIAAAVALTAGSAISQEMTKLRINRSPVGQFQGLIIAQQQGWFAERGIEIELAIGTSPDAAIAELISGQSQIAMTGAVPLVAAVANGAPVVAVINGQDDGDIPTHGLLVMGDSPVQSITDLKGKKIGLPGIASPQGHSVLKAIEAAGMKRDDVELVNLPFPGVNAAIESGAVDAGIPIGLFFDFGKAGGMRELTEYTVIRSSRGSQRYSLPRTRGGPPRMLRYLSKFVEAMEMAHDWANAKSLMPYARSTSKTRHCRRTT